MGIPIKMTARGVGNAIPPAYAEWIGRAAMRELGYPPMTTSTAKLDAALNLIPLDASDRLGQALHAAGCPLDEWLAWCEFRAATKDDYVRLAAECRTAWAQFPESQAGRNPNAVFDLAEEFGWIPDARAAKTEANRKSAARAAAWDLADELDLPAHLRNDHPERDDLARLCRYGADDLRVVQGERCYIALPSGFWTPIYGSNDNAAGALSLLLDHTQRQAAAEAADSDGLRDSEYPHHPDRKHSPYPPPPASGHGPAVARGGRPDWPRNSEHRPGQLRQPQGPSHHSPRRAAAPSTSPAATSSRRPRSNP